MTTTPQLRHNQGMPSVEGSIRPELGDVVVLPGGEKGVLRYIGGIHGKTGDYAGVEMLPEFEDHGRHNGEFRGVKYFDTALPNTGVFIAISKLSRAAPAVNPVTVRSNSSAVRRRSSLRTPTSLRFNTNSVNLQPGNVHLSPAKASMSSPSSHGRPVSRSGSGNTAMPAIPAARFSSPRRTGNFQPKPLSPSNNLANDTSRAQSLSPRKPRASGFHHPLQQQPSPRIPSNESSQQIASLTQELESTRAALSEKEVRLKDQFELIHDMEKSLNELQHLISSKEDDKRVSELQKEIKEKDEKIVAMKQEFEQKRQDFRLSMETLQYAIDQRDFEYNERIKELEAVLESHAHTTETGASSGDSETRQHLQKQVDMLQNELNMMKQSEMDAQAQLTRLADAENKLLDREQELTDTKESLKHFQELLSSNNKNDAVMSQVREQLEYEKSRSQSLEGKLGEQNMEYQAKYSQLQEQIRVLRLENDDITQQLSAERNERKRLKKECENMENMLESRVMKETEMESELLELRQLRSSSAGSSNSGDSPAADPVASRPITPLNSSNSHRRNGSSVVPNHVLSPQSNQGQEGLPVYRSPSKTDPTAGRQLWCGLCEREGHESLDCPYEEEF